MKKKLFFTISLVWIIVSPIYSQSRPEWITLPDMPTGRFGHCSVVYQDKVWIIGGKNQINISLNNVDCYNLKTSEWEPNVSELLHARYNAAAVVYENKIFVIGGHNDHQILSSVEYYDPNDNNWKEFTSLLYQREGANAVVFDGKLYVIGGRSNKGFFPKILDVVEFWDGTAHIWQESTVWHLQKPRVFMQSVAVDSFIYTMGGVWIDKHLDLNERFGFSSGTELVSPLPDPRFYFSAVRIQKLIYILGGIHFGDFDELHDSIDYYATHYDTWRALEISMKNPRAGLSAVGYENEIYVFGGMDANLKVLNTVEVLTGIPTDIVTSVVSINKPGTLPKEHRLLFNFPNPFNSVTTISFQIASTAHQLQLIIYNVTGERVRTYQLSWLAPGFHQVQWDGRDDHGRTVESGIYLAQLRSDRSLGKVLKLSFIK